MEYVTLNNGVKMPMEGFGVFQVPDPVQCEKAVLHAIDVGYRLIDTAAAYMNEQAVGASIAKCGVPREELFITTKQSYMWLYRTSGCTEYPIVLYKYQPIRKAEHAQAFLKDFSGWLHVDGYQGYHKLPENIRVVGCWAHARRKFDEALQTPPKRNGRTLRRQPASVIAPGCFSWNSLSWT